MLVTSFQLSFVLNDLCNSNLYQILYLLFTSKTFSQPQFLFNLFLMLSVNYSKVKYFVFKKKFTKLYVLVISFLLYFVLNYLCSLNLHRILYLSLSSNILSHSSCVICLQTFHKKKLLKTHFCLACNIIKYILILVMIFRYFYIKTL